MFEEHLGEVRPYQNGVRVTYRMRFPHLKRQPEGLAAIASQYQVDISPPNENKVVEISTLGSNGTSLPMLVQDVYHCIRALIREELTLSGEALPPAPPSSRSDEESFRTGQR